MTTTVNDIEHIESQSLNGMGVIKVFFHPNVKIDMAIAQITAICQAAVRDTAARHHAAADHHLQRVAACPFCS